MTDGQATGADGSRPNDQISAMPTKAFFVEMFTRDIQLEQAVLDLVDNSIDGARRMQREEGAPLSERWIRLTLSKDRFEIVDNCGGFSRQAAIDYAFRFGRPRKLPNAPHSIGRFGVGMKRALFKFGSHFTVQSATASEEWGVEVDVPTWESAESDWHFPWKQAFNPASGTGTAQPGTEIVVAPLHLSVGLTFATKRFQREIVDLIKTRHRSFVNEGVAVTVNDERVQGLDLVLQSSTAYRPSVWMHDFDDPQDPNAKPVRTRVIAGLGDSIPRQAGWYVICNGRVILFADRRAVTGWSTVEDNAKTVVPAYHGQYARFRGIATFDCDDSSRLPWNTTKTDVDQDSPIWRKTLQIMVEAMRPVIAFLNELDDEIEEQGRDKSRLVKSLSMTNSTRFETLVAPAAFSAPDREELPPVEKQVKIQYSKSEEDIEILKAALSQPNAKAVGSKTFDLILQRHRP